MIANLKNGVLQVWDSIFKLHPVAQLDFNRIQDFISDFSPSTPPLSDFSMIRVPQQHLNNCGIFMLGKRKILRLYISHF